MDKLCGDQFKHLITKVSQPLNFISWHAEVIFLCKTIKLNRNCFASTASNRFFSRCNDEAMTT